MDSQYNENWQTTKRTVLERNMFMFNNPLMSDVKLRCAHSNRTFFAHKYVLATSSPVFYAMFYGVLADHSEEICLSDAEEGSFEQFLRFIYTDNCELTPENAVKVAYQANKYIIPALSHKCMEVLSTSIKLDNVFTILETSLQYSEPSLEEKCWKFIDSQTTINSDDIVYLRQRTLKALLKRDTLKVNEVELYRAVCVWLEFQCQKNGLECTQENRRVVLGDALYDMRFTVMSQAEFTHKVSSNGLLHTDESLLIFQKFNGLSPEDFPWKLAKRGITLTRHARRPVVDILPPDSGWSYRGGCPDRLCFSVNKDIVLHGVHLFGSPNKGTYQVTMKINGSVVTGTFSSELIRRGRYSWHGYDVMLRNPMKVRVGKTIEIVAQICGPPSYYYEGKGNQRVPPGPIIITFSESSEPANGTNTNRGQFGELIFQE